MANIPRPFREQDGGTGADNFADARTNMQVPLNTTVLLRDGSQPATGDLNMGGFKVTGSADPTQPTHLVTKQYADSLISGFQYKTACKVGTTGNITLSGEQTIDGVAAAAGDRVFVLNQSDATTNGIYVVASGAWSRSTDADDSAEVTRMAALCLQGTTNGGSSFGLTTTGSITLGVTALSFTQITSGSTVNGGDGLTQSGNTLNVGQGTGIQVNADSIQISPTYPGQVSIAILGNVTTGTWNGTEIAINKGGTGATTDSGARANLGAAPKAAQYYVASTNSELDNEIVLQQGSGITLTAGTIAIDTTVVVTLTGNQILENKRIKEKVTAYTDNVNPLLVTDAGTITFNIGSDKTLTLPAGTSTFTGVRFTIKNKAASTGVLTIVRSGSDLIDGQTSYPLIPEECVELMWDGSEWIIL